MKWHSQKIGYLSTRYLVSCSCLLLGLIVLSGCALPSKDWHSRMEDHAKAGVFILQKIDKNTGASVRATKDKEIIFDWEEELKKIKIPTKSPEDNSSSDWLETLIYILIGMSGLGGVAKGAIHLRNMPTKR